MSTQTELKPCPFCGGTKVSFKEGSTFRWRKMECDECLACCGEVRIQTSGEGRKVDWDLRAYELAADEWNTRASLDNQSDDMGQNTSSCE